VLSWLAGVAVLAVLVHGTLVNLDLISVSIGDMEAHKSIPIRAFRGVGGMGRENAEPAATSATAQALALNGNFLLHVRAVNRDEAAKTYFRMVYSLYPKRVYVCEANRLVGSFPEGDFYPGAPWAREHDVHWVIQTDPMAGGGFEWAVYPYGGSPRGAGAGGPAENRP
jgi:hypothetical protein